MPAGSWDGTCEASCDAANCTLKATAELEDPGLGFVTKTCAFAISAGGAVPVAVSCVAELKVVFNGFPANKTCAPFTNLLPVTTSVKFPPERVVAETNVTMGTGL